MREIGGREQRRESCGETRKRNHIYFEESDEERTKRHKRVSRAQTLTVNSDFNQFRIFRSSSSSSSRWNSINRNASWGSRKWVYSSGDFSNYKDKIVIVSYNILGVENAAKHPDSYLNVPQKFLSWSWRKNLIRKEINGYKASIICFQEVDRFDDLCDFLKKDGFKGVYMPRTGEACDGCAIFWKNKLFSLLHEEKIEFQSFGLNHNVAQFCILKMNKKQLQSKSHKQESKSKLSPNRSLVVGNIHVLYNPRRGDIKLGQVRLFLEKAHCLSQEWGNIPVTLAGDLNSTPQSPMYQFLESSRLNVQFLDRRNISGQQEYETRGKGFSFQNYNMRRCTTSVPHSKTWMNGWSEEELMLATGSTTATHLQHNLKLYSAYLGVPGSRATRDDYGEPLATSHHSNFSGTVDYIWHTEELIPVRVLDTLPMHILRRTGGLPSKIWGSDHLALVCELAFANEDDDNKVM